MARADGGGETRLVAYVVPPGEPRAGAGELRGPSAAPAARVHAALRAGGAGGAAADPQRQGGPPGAAGAGDRGRQSAPSRCRRARRWRPSWPASGSEVLGIEADRGARRLLRAGRQLDHRRRADQPAAAGAGRDRPRGGDLRPADGGPARRLPGGGARRRCAGGSGSRRQEATAAAAHGGGSRSRPDPGRARATLHRAAAAAGGHRRLPKNPPAVFVLSPPRSGSTLLRVMLGGHPASLRAAGAGAAVVHHPGGAARRFTGRDAFWREGLIRAVMELRGLRPRRGARRRLRAEARGADDARALPPAPGVDRRPAAGRQDAVLRLEPSILRRAEEGFEGAHYLHLVRHPCGMIRSFEEAKLDQIFFRRAHRLHAPPARGADLAASAAEHPRVPGRDPGGAPARGALRGSGRGARSRCCAESARSWGSTTTPPWRAPYQGDARRG